MKYGIHVTEFGHIPEGLRMRKRPNARFWELDSNQFIPPEWVDLTGNVTIHLDVDFGNPIYYEIRNEDDNPIYETSNAFRMRNDNPIYETSNAFRMRKQPNGVWEIDPDQFVSWKFNVLWGVGTVTGRIPKLEKS